MDLKRTLGLILSGDIKAQDGVYVARAAGESPASRAVLVEWVSNNLEAIVEKMPGFGAARMVGSVRRICDSATRAEAAEKIGAAIEKLKRPGRRLKEALESSALCIDLRGRQAARATAYLKKKRRF